MYVIKFKGRGDYKLYYRGYKFYQDSPTEGGWKIFRTIYLADAMLFADRMEAEEEIEIWEWPEEHLHVDYITDNELAEAKRFKFKEQLSGNYIESKG